MKGEGADHVCTKRCLRWTVGFGRRWYYCAIYSWDPDTKCVVRNRKSGRAALARTGERKDEDG